jgi:hypothetical protein
MRGHWCRITISQHTALSRPFGKFLCTSQLLFRAVKTPLRQTLIELLSTSWVTTVIFRIQAPAST